MWKLVLFLCILIVTTYAKRQSAAVIVGGYWPTKDGSQPIHDSVELFGCAGANGASIPLPSLPGPTHLMGGMHFHDPDGILVCGGHRCEMNDVCGVTDICSIYHPDNETWTDGVVSNMLIKRFSFLLAQGPNAEFGGDTDNHPIALGYYRDSIIYSRTSAEWKDYLEVPPNWFSLNCLVQDNFNHDSQEEESIYHIGTTIERINMGTWKLTDLGAVPDPLKFPGKCAAVIINGERGIFTRFGMFFRFSDKQWIRYTPPPLNPLASQPNAMWGFRDRPTIFGNPSCNDNAVCIGNEVIQYHWETDEWISLGFMTTPRRFHEVIEVNGEFCDYFVDATSPVITPATTPTTKAPTTTPTQYSPGTTTIPISTAPPPVTTTTTAASSSIATMNFLGILSLLALYLTH